MLLFGSFFFFAGLIHALLLGVENQCVFAINFVKSFLLFFRVENLAIHNLRRPFLISFIPNSMNCIHSRLTPFFINRFQLRDFILMNRVRFLKRLAATGRRQQRPNQKPSHIALAF
jgi:hypothetical protein